MNQVSHPMRAAAHYFAIVFAVGFVLGTIRTIWGAEALGETTFILIEVPMMLLVSFLAARWLVRRHSITRLAQALSMGLMAFGLLMLAELTLTVALAPDDPALAMNGWFDSLWVSPGLYGLLAQIVFALLPFAILQFRSD